MKQEPKKNLAANGRAGAGPMKASPDIEPTAGTESSPMVYWFLGILAALLVWGDLFLVNHGGDFNAKVYSPYISFKEVEKNNPKKDEDPRITDGRKIYASYCAACHQKSGGGVVGQFPPLANSDWVVGVGPDRVIRIVLDGLTGPITVNGVAYNNTMLPWRDSLDDKQIAAVVSYIRASKDKNDGWNNDASLVTPEQVKAIRGATADHGQNWTADDLLKIPHGQ